MKLSRPNRLVCLTPVKNEGWILNLFLQAASLWADNIILADQLSTDDTRLIANKFPKVILVNNNRDIFDEHYRQKILLTAARKLSGVKTLVALDADEILTPNFDQPDWRLLKSSPPKTVFYFQVHNLNRDLDMFWTFDKKFPLAVVDDGVSSLSSGVIHHDRLPYQDDWAVVQLSRLAVLHYQYVDPQRNESKRRWYLMWEKINHPKRHPIDLYRQYYHDKILINKRWKKLPASWLDKYAKQGIDLRDYKITNTYWWEDSTQNWLEKYGADFFSPLGATKTTGAGKRLLLSYLNLSQRYYPRYGINRVDNVLKKHAKN